MSDVLIITGSPSSTSRTLRFASVIRERLGKLGVDSALLDLRTLPAEPLLHANAAAPEIAAAVAKLAAARGVVVLTPVYKAAYTGVLKAFLDLLPQFALRHKVIAPFAVGGTVAHVLSIDYALRPVLHSLDPLHVVAGLFVLDKQITVHSDEHVTLDADLEPKVDAAVEVFVQSLRRLAA